MEKNINFWSCSVRKAFCYVGICLLTLVKIMLILIFNNILYISSKWSNWVTVMNCKMNRSISMFWVCYFVFPFQRRGLETLTRKWKGSRGRGHPCPPPPPKNSTKPCPLHTLMLLPPPEETVIFHLFFLYSCKWKIIEIYMILFWHCS